MAHEGLTKTLFAGLLAGLLAGSLAACGNGAAASSPTNGVAAAPSPSGSSEPAAFTNDLERMKRFHSKRFGLVVPFPDGKTWRIDDHSSELLTATHAPTSSSLVLGTFPDEELMSRQKCEARARSRGLVPRGDLRTIEDKTTFLLGDFDARVWVAVEPPAAGKKSVVGHVFAFGGFLRKCLVFHFASVIDNGASASEEDALSSRLAFAKTRILGEMSADDFASVPRETTPAPAPSGGR